MNKLLNPGRMLSILILFSITHFISISGGGNSSSQELFFQQQQQQQQHMVVASPTEYRVAGGDLMAAVLNGGGGSRRRELGAFQLCLACKCCGVNSDPSNCVTVPCCFAIDCQLPNKPFGVCAFVPKICNCTTCATT